ncbi:bifunctional ornithine acetyltransferase/N-acetylglutamate synthase [Methanosphaera sp. WGK6]|uniref:bifunctional ornithine acetyltransferase/N-acetylglutamate synthase n=1 Tax=Methanosphaera sp. WGK6 TaxID=1561964 RepID=UPI00084BF2E6|nr:bifunctional ornithine acetyltransferase/N-acetylglutamate synthase [Methanosphaera sp. WGK6]OED30152.1 ornithine acetyltransferase [Methanosphaera sp. WGK6]
MKILEDGICSISSIKASGYREGKYGVTILYHENSTAAAVFTTNKVYAAPIDITRKHLEDGNISAVIVNSGNANCYTKEDGIKKGLELAQLVADDLSIPLEDVAVASTGVIGRQMPMDIIKPVAIESLGRLGNSRQHASDAANAILTTDTVTKECAVEASLNDGTVFRVAGMCKGSGMIAPNMGTMLGFITTNLKINKNTLQEALRESVKKSFNMVVVDGDESTNDTVLVMSTNEIEAEIDENFQEALDYVCISLAKQIAKDGEGAKKFMEVVCEGAKSLDDAILVSKSVVSSSLVKTALAGADPNWGRIISAMGYSGVDFDPDNVSISIGSGNETVVIVDKGDVKTYSNPEQLEKAEELMGKKDIVITVNLHDGDASTTAYGCDLTYDYVRINAEYTT